MSGVGYCLLNFSFTITIPENTRDLVEYTIDVETLQDISRMLFVGQPHGLERTWCSFIGQERLSVADTSESADHALRGPTHA